MSNESKCSEPGKLEIEKPFEERMAEIPWACTDDLMQYFRAGDVIELEYRRRQADASEAHYDVFFRDMPLDILSSEIPDFKTYLNEDMVMFDGRPSFTERLAFRPHPVTGELIAVFADRPHPEAFYVDTLRARGEQDFPPGRVSLKEIEPLFDETLPTPQWEESFYHLSDAHRGWVYQSFNRHKAEREKACVENSSLPSTQEIRDFISSLPKEDRDYLFNRLRLITSRKGSCTSPAPSMIDLAAQDSVERVIRQMDNGLCAEEDALHPGSGLPPAPQDAHSQKR